MKNRQFAVTGLLTLIGLGIAFGGICLATGKCANQLDASTVASAASAETKKEIRWHTKLDSAMTESAGSGKLIFVDFHAAWCPPCKMMDEQTFTNAAFIKESENWVMLKIDTDKEVETAAKYRVQGLPTLAVLKTDGKPVAATEGYHSARELLEFMQAARNQVEAEQPESE